MVSVHILNQTSLSKPLFKEILQNYSTIVILQILVKKSFKYLLKVRSSDKFVVKIIFCLLSLFLWKIWVSNYPNRRIVTLKHFLKLIKQTKQRVYMNTFCFYLKKINKLKSCLHDFVKIPSSSKIYLNTL